LYRLHCDTEELKLKVNQSLSKDIHEVLVYTDNPSTLGNMPHTTLAPPSISTLYPCPHNTPAQSPHATM